MNQMFLGAAMFNGNVSGWNPSSGVTNMSQHVQRDATSFDGNLSGWNTS